MSSKDDVTSLPIETLLKLRQQNKGTYRNHRRIGEDISDLREHVKFLYEATPMAPEYNGFDVEFNFIERRTGQEDFEKNYTTANLEVNRNKNRYTNVLPPEDTRVSLDMLQSQEGTDYINANFIAGDVSAREFISTQGPLPNTVCDFWRMIWEHKSTVIVMLTKETENGREKCHRYWPEKRETLVFDSIRVQSISEDTNKPYLVERRLVISHVDEPEVRRDVWHLQYTAWPDHGLPSDTSTFLSLIAMVDDWNQGKAPIAVHCSAGIGRTGTFCTVHNTIHQLRRIEAERGEVPLMNIVKAVLDLRDQRPGMVQTKDQYKFCYLAVLDEYNKIVENAEKKYKQKKHLEGTVPSDKDTEDKKL
eukprot:CAMPEP_0168525440 /NCGR_PEP_ID=MMETSP0405-20121227/11292_1 /TAXON_ID=498012 /ORGANISM="Trichosphaerium sp, Strain Am-I-7 wt" /LENGTH=361 /DNA_ID=CAMNT_0008547929 /DNA_START=125 /DNA_END=1210 /DNA_ORIENTATION=+